MKALKALWNELEAPEAAILFALVVLIGVALWTLVFYRLIGKLTGN